VARFIGSPPMDVLRGEIVSENGSILYRVGVAVFPFPERAANALRAIASARGTDLGVRSEHILLTPPGDGVAATVQVVQPLGPSTVVTVAWDGGSLTARVPGIAALPLGETIGLHLDPAGLLFFDRETGQRLET
jgi:multiple sugar transport system ATP-binding protein